MDRSSLRRYSEGQIIRYASINQLIRQIPIGKIGGLYVSRISQMCQYEAIARECGRNPICVWSLSNKEYPATEEQLRVRNYILDKEAVPDEYDLFIFNASCETAINIRSHADFFISHNTNITHIEQARGRYRSDIETLYVLDIENGIFSVPEEYLNRPLFKEDKNALRASIGIKNDKGRYIPWKKLTQRLTDCGYSFSEGRIDDRPYTRFERM